MWACAGVETPDRKPGNDWAQGKGRSCKVKKSRFKIALVACAAVAAVAALPAAAQAKQTITISGSTSVAPLMTKWARAYARSNSVGFRILQGGSDVGVADVSKGAVTIGMSSRDPKSGDPGGLVWNKVSKDALCVITNKSNGVSNLTQAQVQAIFGGSVRNWNSVSGSPKSGTIDVIVRTAASGTQDAFKKLFLGSTSVFSGATQKASSGLVEQAVKSNPNAIGYVSLAFTKGEVNSVAYNGTACTLRNAKAGTYQGTRNFWVVTKGAPSGAAKKFIDWIRNSRAAAKLADSEWVSL
jgi:phosphate transport system substrate-binding protein